MGLMSSNSKEQNKRSIVHATLLALARRIARWLSLLLAMCQCLEDIRQRPVPCGRGVRDGECGDPRTLVPRRSGLLSQAILECCDV